MQQDVLYTPLNDVSLTERELEVLHLKTKRRTNAEIAKQLFISITTVKWYVRQIYNKLGVNNRAEAVASAQQLGLFSQNPESRYQPFSNLPEPLTPFIGRKQELNHLVTMLKEPASRLVTVTGIGGIGKTRLALQAATALRDRFADGIVWISFSAQDDTEFVLSTTEDYIAVIIASTIGLSLRGEESPTQLLKKHLHKKNVLIILDRFEHLLSGASFICELLKSTTTCKFLITSRERLDIPGEILYTVQGLSVTHKTDDDSPLSDAEVLFLQTVNRVADSDNLEISELSALHRICLRLQGMPLAIELAADWARLLPMAEIESRVEHGLDFLDNGWISIRAIIDRSWNLLTDEQSVSFARLAVFQHGFTGDAAHHVAGIDLQILSVLFDKSLIQRASNDRYTIHDLLRQFAVEQLSLRGEMEATRDAHCVYFADLAASQMESIHRGDHSKMLADLPNLRAAWQWAVEHRRLDDLVKMLFSLDWFYNMRAYYAEGAAAMRLAADALRMAHPEGLQGLIYGKALASYGLQQSFILGADQAEPATRQGIEVLRQLGEREHLAWPQILSVFLNIVRDPQDQEQFCLESLAIFEEMGNLYGEAFALAVLGTWYRENGRYTQAQLTIERSLAISRSIGDKEGAAHALQHLGHLNLHRGQFEAARVNFEEEYALWNTLALSRLAGGARRSLGETALAAGDYAVAEPLLQESLAAFEEVGDDGNALLSLLDLGQIAWLRKRSKKAESLLQDAHQIVERRHDSGEQARWQQLAGRVYLQQGDMEAARLTFDQALVHSIQAGGTIFIETVLDFALLYQAESDEENAARLLGYAQAQTGLPAPLVRNRVEPLYSSLNAAMDADVFIALLEAGATLDQQALVDNILLADEAYS